MTSPIFGPQEPAGTISSLTGDVTASGTGAVAATLATVNGAPGSFTNATITVNGKGLVTVASSGTGGAALTVTDSINSVANVTQITFLGGDVVGGATPNATVTYTPDLLLGLSTSGFVLRTGTNAYARGEGYIENAGGGSIAVGHAAGTGAPGNSLGQVALGESACGTNSTGQFNVGIGANALLGLAGGGSNMAIGAGSLGALTNGTFNVAVGASSMRSETIGSQNVTLGAFTFLSQNGASGNVGIGFELAENLTTGANNTLLGTSCADTITTASHCIVIGAGQDVPSATNNLQLNIGGDITGTLGTVINIGSSLTVSGNQVPVLVSAPVHNTSTGVPGQLAFDASFFYVCIASNSWARVAIGGAW